jgi:hypothetical protein
MPTWVKVAPDTWTLAAGFADGFAFRPVNRGDQVQGECMSEKVVWQMLQPYAATAGVPGIAPHDLRRTCAKLCRAAGGELEQIQLLLGHASVQTTERYLGTPSMPLSTLHSAPLGAQRKTRGQDGSLLLSCRPLSSPTARRFIPTIALAHDRDTPSCRATAEEPNQRVSMTLNLSPTAEAKSRPKTSPRKYSNFSISWSITDTLRPVSSRVEGTRGNMCSGADSGDSVSLFE